METIKVEIVENTAIIKISRPEKMNALNSQVLEELSNSLSSIKKDDDIFSVIITGEGEKAFVAGADIKELNNLNMIEALELSKNGQKVFNTIEEFNKPIIAAINGFALGGGCELALSCHIRIASEKASIILTEVLDQYNIDEKWVSNLSKVDSISEYLVILPKEVPFPYILRDLAEKYNEFNYVTISTKELGINGKNNLNVKFSGKAVFNAVFQYDRNLKRRSDSLGFILYDFDKLSKEQVDKLNSLTYPLIYVFSPSINNKNLPKLVASNKKYALLIDDNVQDVEYRFKKEYDKKRLSLSVKAMVIDYPKSKALIVNNKSEFVSFANYNLIKNELSTSGKKILPLSNLTLINDIEDTYETFIKIVRGKKSNYFIKAEDFIELIPYLDQLLKKGYKLKYSI